MARPKKDEETLPLHTRLTTSQLAGFREYLRRQQDQVRHTGMQLTDAAVLRGMVLRCLELEGIPHSAQPALPLRVAPIPAPPEPPPAPPEPPPAPPAPPEQPTSRTPAEAPASEPPPPRSEQAASAPVKPPATSPSKKKSATKKPAPSKSAGSKMKKPTKKGSR